jgi:putative RNA 2'-phosphotransferase
LHTALIPEGGVRLRILSSQGPERRRCASSAAHHHFPFRARHATAVSDERVELLAQQLERGAESSLLMDLTLLSKSISRILRHRPEAAGVRLDRHGWCVIDELLRGLAQVGTPTTREQLVRVVLENDKQRFVLSEDGTRIRAAQGHSLSNVEPLLRQKKPPSRLFHGTVAAALPNIDRDGLLPMKRHHVHLSPDETTARAVGGRRGTPVVLVIDAARMERDGHKFFVSDNEVWLTDAVPPKYLHRAT